MPRSSLSRLLAGALVVSVLGASVFLTSCDLLDVENPNSVLEEDLEEPTSAQSIRNGAVATTARAHSYMYALHSTASDELTRIGSFDAWNQTDRTWFGSSGAFPGTIQSPTP